MSKRLNAVHLECMRYDDVFLDRLNRYRNDRKVDKAEDSEDDGDEKDGTLDSDDDEIVDLSPPRRLGKILLFFEFCLKQDLRHRY